MLSWRWWTNVRIGYDALKIYFKNNYLHEFGVYTTFNLYFYIVEHDSSSWFGSDRDYTYDELLKRVFEIILDKNPDMAAGRKPKFVMRPPQVLRVGTKKTSFANFTDICKTLHR